MSSNLKLVIWILVFALVVTVGTTLYYYNAYSKIMAQVSPQNNAANQAVVADLVNKVGKIMVLPTNETPTVATVVDPNLLKSQPFFVNAQKGDAVLIYTSAKMAILYDPSTNKIVNVAPITIGSPAPTPTPTVPTSSK